MITLNDELGKDKNLEATKIRGHKTWNELLNRIQVEGGTDEQMKTFYSCLFRANLSSHANSMNVKRMENLIIIVLMTAKYMMDICIQIMASGTLSVLNFH